MENTQGNCKKKSFDTAILAQERMDEINKSNPDQKKKLLRKYKCKTCNKFHLTSMTKQRYIDTKDVEGRQKARERSFINRETEYWSKRFKLNIE